MTDTKFRYVVQEDPDKRPFDNRRQICEIYTTCDFTGEELLGRRIREWILIKPRPDSPSVLEHEVRVELNFSGKEGTALARTFAEPNALETADAWIAGMKFQHRPDRGI